MPIAIEVKQDALYLVEGKVKGDKLELKNAFNLPIAEEWLDSDGVRDIDMLGILLSQAIKDNGFKSKDVILTLNNSSVIYRELYLPRIEAKRLALIVRSEMMEVLNLTPDYIMDFVVLDESVSDEGKPMVRVLAVASPSLAIRSYLELIKQTKLRLKCIDKIGRASCRERV